MSERRYRPNPSPSLADALAAKGHGLIMVMGKGVGKTAIAAALAVGLVQRGHSVHLTTTDPAAHVQSQLDGSLPGLKVGRIDPHAETQAYIDKIMATRGKALDDAGRALLLEDLQSPCTEEVAVFRLQPRGEQEPAALWCWTRHPRPQPAADGRHRRLPPADDAAVRRQRERQTHHHAADAPAGCRHDPRGHRHVARGHAREPGRCAARRPAPRPHRALGLGHQQSVAATGTSDPLLQARLAGEQQQAARIAGGLAQHTYVLPWLATPPVGVDASRAAGG
ncbi:MAG: ArsA-related P-loop ATPase [Inhella sp.]